MLSLLIPAKISISWGNKFLKILGPLGSIIKHKNNISLALKNNRLYFLGIKENQKKYFYWSLLHNLILGVLKGYRRKLKLVGVGYRSVVKENKLFLKIGFSHEIIYNIPRDIIIQTSKLKGVLILIKGIELFRVCQVASKIRSFRRPDIYKGKGIHYYKEKLILKKGKRETK